MPRGEIGHPLLRVCAASTTDSKNDPTLLVCNFFLKNTWFMVRIQLKIICSTWVGSKSRLHSLIHSYVMRFPLGISDHPRYYVIKHKFSLVSFLRDYLRTYRVQVTPLPPGWHQHLFACQTPSLSGFLGATHKNLPGHGIYMYFV